MNARFVLACAASGLAWMAAGAGHATADGEAGTLGISPSVIVSGDTVTLDATCADPGFTAPAPVESGVLVPATLTGEVDEHGVWRLSATTTVRTDVTPGSWSAMFQCGADDVVVRFQTYGAAEQYHAVIGVDDDVVRAGREVRVSARCHDPEFTGSEIDSPVLTAPPLTRKEGGAADDVLFSTGRIAGGTAPGTYPVHFSCAGRAVSGEFTVVAGQTPAPRARPVAQVPVTPKGAPETGRLDQAAPAEDDDLGIVLGAGAAALLAAGGAGVLAHRRRGQS